MSRSAALMAWTTLDTRVGNDGSRPVKPRSVGAVGLRPPPRRRVALGHASTPTLPCRDTLGQCRQASRIPSYGESFHGSENPNVLS